MIWLAGSNIIPSESVPHFPAKWRTQTRFIKGSDKTLSISMWNFSQNHVDCTIPTIWWAWSYWPLSYSWTSAECGEKQQTNKHFPAAYVFLFTYVSRHISLHWGDHMSVTYTSFYHPGRCGKHEYSKNTTLRQWTAWCRYFIWIWKRYCCFN